jgi:hypothetical protein
MSEGERPMSAAHEHPAEPTYADVHGMYRAAGWIGPLPLGEGTKYPPPDGFTGWHGIYPSGADSQTWVDEYPEYATTRQVALRMADDVIGIDVDQYANKNGAETLAEAERRWGKLPPAPWSSARGNGPSGIRFYRVPPGTELRTKIGFPELKLGGIEIIQRHHRYAVVWPSIHPETGAGYRWYSTASPSTPPRVANIKPLPTAWLEALESDGTPGEAAANPKAVIEFMQTHSDGGDLHAIRGVLTVFHKGITGGGSRHDAMVSSVCMAAREARDGRYPAADVRAALRNAFTQALSEARGTQRLSGPAEARREFDSMWAWGIGQAIGESDDDRATRQEFAAARRLEPTRLTPVEVRSGHLNLPADFWNARPSLKHIRDAALSRWACPDAVLGAVLARLSAYASPDDHVDLGIGQSPLTVFSVLYGSPSAGKGVAMRTAAELLPVPAHLGMDAFRERPIGSGEGITESFYGIVSDTDASGKAIKVRKQVRHNALFVMDEGETLIRLMTRQGSTLATTIRRAWSGEVLGEANASADRDRQVDRKAYSIGLTVAFQPAAIAPLFDDQEVGGGTPHRFIYLAADDDTLPEDPPEEPLAWPGELHLATFHDPALAKQWEKPPGRTHELVDSEVRRQVRMTRWRGLRRDSIGELDGHADQMRGRIAAHLAALDGHLEVTGEDWALAGQVLETSNRVREAAIAYGRRRISAAAKQADERHVQREALVEQARLSVADQVAEERIRRGAAVVARKVLRDAPADGLATGALRDAAGRYKRDVAACLELAVELGWLLTEDAKQGGTRYRVGPSIGEVSS